MSRPDTPLRLLAEYRPVEFPENGSSRRHYLKPFALMSRNARLTIAFGATQFDVLKPDSELYDTVQQARKESMTVVKAAKRAMMARGKNFEAEREKVLAAYGNLKSSVRHIFWLADRQLYERVDESL